MFWVCVAAVWALPLVSLAGLVAWSWARAWRENRARDPLEALYRLPAAEHPRRTSGGWRA